MDKLIVCYARYMPSNSMNTQSTSKTDHWVAIPYDAANVRQQAKALGARFDRETKGWGLPTQAAADTIIEAVTAWRKERDASTIANSGRTVTSNERVTFTHRYPGGYGRSVIEASAPKVGAVEHLKGRHFLVLEVDVYYLGRDDAEELDWSPRETPGWQCQCEGVEVAPTDEEAAAEEKAVT